MAEPDPLRCNILKPTPPGLPLSGEELSFPPDKGGPRGVGLRRFMCYLARQINVLLKWKWNKSLVNPPYDNLQRFICCATTTLHKPGALPAHFVQCNRVFQQALHFRNQSGSIMHL